MANTYYVTYPSSQPPRTLGAHEWLHREYGNSPDFDSDFYRLQPRMGLYAASRWDAEISRAGAYPGPASPSWEISLQPHIGKNIGLVFDLFVEAASTGKIKFRVKKGASARDDLQLRNSSGTIIAEVTTTQTRASVNSDRTLGTQRVVAVNMATLTNSGDTEGEDLLLDMYLENTTSTVVCRNMRIYAGMSQFVEDYLK